MARSIEQVEQDLTQMSAASSQLGAELAAAYKSYFISFAPTLKQQSIQSCYYLCTTCYPETFLKLNYNQRSQLLKTLQRVIRNVIGDLVIHIEPSPPTSNEDAPTGELTSTPAVPIDWFATPQSLSTWQKNLELELSRSLQEISYKVNLLLQQAQVMPPVIPKPILEASPEADRQAESTGNIPNLLSVLIEQESSEQQQAGDNARESQPRDDTAQIVQIHSLYLRLTEVEFSEVTVLSSRKNLDRLVSKINSLRREYIQKQQELKVAEAESAWRNSWFECP
ncbi:hypothetical protein [Chamaesiphon sp.]|uniref:hypothetical protein n=1 Tax=Chamaesiphon sp. TaxID=2814140 RepID=UPI0035948EE6